MTTSTVQTTDLLNTVLTDLTAVVATVTNEQRHDPTPCASFDVEQLLHHILGWLTTFAAAFADPDGRAPRADLDDFETPADAVAAIRAAADQMDQALRAGAAERPMWLGSSSMPGDMSLSMILLEYTVHGWDLARATGQAWTPSSEACEASLAFATMMLNGQDQGEGEGGMFGKPVDVPAGAPALDRLLGLSGRDPHWQAGAA